MANQGILAKGKPGNSLAVLYSCPIDKSASTVLHVANDGTGAAIDVAIKDFDQKLIIIYLAKENDELDSEKLGAKFFDFAKNNGKNKI